MSERDGGRHRKTLSLCAPEQLADTLTVQHEKQINVVASTRTRKKRAMNMRVAVAVAAVAVAMVVVGGANAALIAAPQQGPAPDQGPGWYFAEFYIPLRPSYYPPGTTQLRNIPTLQLLRNLPSRREYQNLILP